MSHTIIRIDQLDEAIKNEIDKMNRNVIDQCNDAAKRAASSGAKTLRNTSPVRKDGSKRKYPPGSYAKSWTYAADKNVLGVNSYVIHNKKHYQLAHLLEFGHIIAKTGGRSKEFPHIAKVNESASNQFVEEVMRMKL